MYNDLTPLTPAECDFAAEHHDLIGAYLSMAGLPWDDFYDIAVFGYLRAVRQYLAQPERQEVRFAVIAFQTMGLDVRRTPAYRQYIRRRAMGRPLKSEDSLLLDFPVSSASQAA